jgi:type I restriction enzyme, R subunit
MTKSNQTNQNPEQIARDRIDDLLAQAGWVIQSKNKIDLGASLGVAIQEYQTATGPADYVLFVDRKPVGIVEAKKEEEGYRLTVVEEQSTEYADSKLKYINSDPLPFVYESTGVLTRFTDRRDPRHRSRPVFSFHRPETFQAWLRQDQSLRARFSNIPVLDTGGLRDCQVVAISNLERSFQENRPRALVQMATGSGKTFTAVTAIYRLLKFADAKRVLFLVDTKNLGEQAEQEFMAFQPNDDNRKFTELYNVQLLKSSQVATNSHVCISTIQRLYAILKGEDLDERAEEENPNDLIQPKVPMPVVYSPKIPIEFFDFIVIDECHRSIYNIWKQVLEYFDGFLIGLTATPDKRTFGFFNENVVSEYSHEDAVADGVNVGHDVYTIETEITRNGSRIVATEYVDKRDKLTRRSRWEQLEEDLSYSGRQLDREIVNPSQIRNIIRAFKEKLPEIFPQRAEVPKTLIFAKNDSHADDIIQIVREEFGEGNAFCKKVTYKSVEDPKSVLAQFRNDYYPRVAVTVDMIATGTDVKPLECLIFMRNVQSRNYFEQMKGRGTRTLEHDDLRKVTPSAVSAKTHFVIVDAIGVTKTIKTDCRPLERQRGVPLKDLMMGIMMGARDEDAFTSLAGRLMRLDRQITPVERERVTELTKGVTVAEMARSLLAVYDLDRVVDRARLDNQLANADLPTDGQLEVTGRSLAQEAAAVFTGDLINYLDNVRKLHEQVIDTVNLDRVEFAGWDVQAQEQATALVADFTAYLAANRDEIGALRVFYNQPFQRRVVTFQMVKELLDIIKRDKPQLAPLRVWQAYEQLEQVNSRSPLSELTALVALIRRVVGVDEVLTSYEATVNRNFQDWVFGKQAGALKFTEEQMEWLRLIKEHVMSSFCLEQGDLDFAPFDAKGGVGKMYQLFGDEMDGIIQEINEGLAA